MRFARTLVGVALVGALTSLLAVPALAATPGNDSFAGAVAVGPGFVDDLATTDATTDADDISANTNCVAPATDASVWYAYTQPTDGGVIIDVSSSTYTAGIIVVTGSPGAFVLHNCGPGTVALSATSGTTYYVLAFDDQLDGGGNGGMLHIAFSDTVLPPTVTVTADPVGRFKAQTGGATVSGTFSCTGADLVSVFGDLRKRVGRGFVTGFFGAGDTACDGATHTWTASVIPTLGKFAGGKAAAVVFSFACGPLQCAQGFSEQAVQLKGGGK